MRRTKRAGKDDGDCRVKSGSSQLYSHVLWGKVSADSEDSDADAALDGEVEETCTPEIPHKDNFELPLGATIAMKVKRAKVFLESDGESEQGEDTVSMMGQAGVLNASPRAAPSSSHAIHAGNSSSGMNNAVAMVHRPNSRSSEGVTEAAGHEVMPQLQAFQVWDRRCIVLDNADHVRGIGLKWDAMVDRSAVTATCVAKRIFV
eukprot:CAMPEP_0178378038 /NCGR_PEP_ID=MMETSP0689_2-20121128/4223_1 /TAXON_ID=160604 /ORGANISM="Amphidinium massartii, Strain CS-259" /LENGTH=203 /DNA_ID=CAMNT_0019998101 /DNA_START=64 /DNA_END=676 /DNA_ORIENTATION=+